MVTCTKCGTENREDARFCVSCGASLYAERAAVKRGDTCFGQPERRMEEECFGLPYGGAIAGVIAGLFIIFLGLSIAFGVNIERLIGPSVLIIVGALIVAGAIYRQSKRKSR